MLINLIFAGSIFSELKLGKSLISLNLVPANRISLKYVFHTCACSIIVCKNQYYIEDVVLFLSDLMSMKIVVDMMSAAMAMASVMKMRQY